MKEEASPSFNTVVDGPLITTWAGGPWWCQQGNSNETRKNPNAPLTKVIVSNGDFQDLGLCDGLRQLVHHRVGDTLNCASILNVIVQR